MYIRINDEQSYEFTPDSGLILLTTFINANGESVCKHKYIANFTLKAIAQVAVHRDGETVPHVRIIPQFTDGKNGEPVIIPLKGLEKVDWTNDVDLRCLLNPETPKANEHIANLLRLQCSSAPEETTTIIDSLGTHIIEGIPVFHCGDRLICPDGFDKNKVIFKPIPNTRLVEDPNCSEQEAVNGMMRIMNLSRETGRVIFAHVLLYVMRLAFVTAGIVPKVFLFLYSKTGFKKTTYAAFQTQLYNRDTPFEPLTRLNASIPAAVKLLYEKDDYVTVLDDLFPAQARDIHRQQEKTMLEITRVIGDGIEPARMRGYKLAKKPPKCGVLATGEYYIGVGSDSARHLPLKLTVPIDNDQMTVCQREPLVLSTYYGFFIKWYVTHFNEIVELLKEWKAAYRSTKTGIHDRLQETQFCLEAAYKLFLTYCEDTGFISRDGAKDKYYDFYQLLRSIVKEQDARVNKGMSGVFGTVNYVALIRSLLQDKRFKLADSPRKLRSDEHDGVMHGDLLYLRRDRLMSKIHSLEPSAEFSEVLDGLKSQQALKPGRKSNSVQLHGCGRGLRFYAIKLGKLR